MLGELILRCFIVVFVGVIIAVLLTFLIGIMRPVEMQDQQAIALCICLLIPYCWLGQYQQWSKKWNVR